MRPEGTPNDDLQRLAYAAVEHLKIIRKYTAWIAFVVVLTFALAVIGVIVTVSEGGSGASDLCTEFPGLC